MMSHSGILSFLAQVKNTDLKLGNMPAQWAWVCLSLYLSHLKDSVLPLCSGSTICLMAGMYGTARIVTCGSPPAAAASAMTDRPAANQLRLLGLLSQMSDLGPG